MPVDSITDRLNALRHGGPQSVAELFERFPPLAMAVGGRGPIARLDDGGWLAPIGYTVDSQYQLASRIAGDIAISFSIKYLSRIESQLLVLARMHGNGFETINEALQLEPSAPRDVLELAARGLAQFFLADRSTPNWLLLRPGVARHVALPGPTIFEFWAHRTKEQLGEALQRLGVSVPTKHGQRLLALQAAARDRGIVENAIEHLSKADREAWDIIAVHGRVDVRSLPGSSRFTQWGHTPTTAHSLLATGLIYIDDRDVAMPWLDVAMALNGAVFANWSAPFSAPTLTSTATGAVAVPPALHNFERAIEQLSLTPAPVLKTGGLGVQPIKAIAKAIGRPVGEVALFMALAVELQLIGTVVVDTHGRGRNLRIDEQWRVDTESWKAYLAHSTPRRWARLVQAWLEALYLPLEPAMATRCEPKYIEPDAAMMRDAAWRIAATMSHDAALRDSDFCALIADQHALGITSEIATTLLAEARAVGVFTADSVALTPVARALVDGTANVEAACDGGPEHFVVQADHSVIAPPDLAASISATLHAVARLESDAGAKIYRITDDSVQAALEHGLDESMITAFLTQHSSTGLPKNVARTIKDAAARFGLLRSGTASTWIVSDDAALLVRATGVKSTALTLIAPNVAVSPLPERKVLELLVAKNIHVVSESRNQPPDDQSRPQPSRLIQRSHVPSIQADPFLAVAPKVASATALPDRVGDDGVSPLEIHRRRLELLRTESRRATTDSGPRTSLHSDVDELAQMTNAEFNSAIASLWDDGAVDDLWDD